MPMTVDWQAIKQAYEQGKDSLSALEREFGVSRQAIKKRAVREKWERPEVTTGYRLQVTGATPPPPKPLPLPMPEDAVSIARIGLSQLARHLQTDALLPIASHKSLSDALSQYVKVLITAPQDTEEQEDGLFIPLHQLSPQTRIEIRRLLVEDAEARKREVS